MVFVNCTGSGSQRARVFIGRFLRLNGKQCLHPDNTYVWSTNLRSLQHILRRGPKSGQGTMRNWERNAAKRWEFLWRNFLALKDQRCPICWRVRAENNENNKKVTREYASGNKIIVKKWQAKFETFASNCCRNLFMRTMCITDNFNAVMWFHVCCFGDANLDNSLILC